MIDHNKLVAKAERNAKNSRYSYLELVEIAQYYKTIIDNSTRNEALLQTAKARLKQLTPLINSEPQKSKMKEYYAITTFTPATTKLFRQLYKELNTKMAFRFDIEPVRKGKKTEQEKIDLLIAKVERNASSSSYSFIDMEVIKTHYAIVVNMGTQSGFSIQEVYWAKQRIKQVDSIQESLLGKKMYKKYIELATKQNLTLEEAKTLDEMRSRGSRIVWNYWSGLKGMKTTGRTHGFQDETKSVKKFACSKFNKVTCDAVPEACTWTVGKGCSKIK